MRGAITSHDGHILLREGRLHALRTELLEEELLLFRKKKIKRLASSGISGHSKSGPQTKLTAGRDVLLTPSTRQSSRPGVRLHKLRFEEL